MSSVRVSALLLGFSLSMVSSIAVGSTMDGGIESVDVVSVRLRQLKGVVSVSGSDLSIYAEDMNRGSLVLKTGFSNLKIQFEARKAKEAWSVFEAARDSSGGSDLGKKIATVFGRKLELRGEGVRVDLRPAPSRVQLVVKGPRSPIHLVGLLDLESYIEGVVASEVPRDWPMDALKAQAVAARSFTVARVRERKSADWLLESSVIDQVFDFDRKHSRASEAVRATNGQILTDSLRRPVKAHYHADCGGRIDSPRAVWTGEGAGNVAGSVTGTGLSRGPLGVSVESGAIIDQSCAVSTRNSWRFVATMEELSQGLRRKQLVPSGFEVVSISVLSRTNGGRAEFLRARSVEGREVQFSGERLRAAFGYSEIRSTLFDIMNGSTRSDGGETARTVPSKTVEFVGRGFGHGAGLCQWGSRQLASDGKTYRQILSHYYPKSKIERLKDSSAQSLARSN